MRFMLLYDGKSPIVWFYRGEKTREEMNGDSYYPQESDTAVLYDDGNGKVYSWEHLYVLCERFDVEMTEDVQATYEAVVKAMEDYVPLSLESVDAKATEAKTTADTAKQTADAAMEAASAGGNPQIMTFARMQVATLDLTTYSDDSVSEINTLLPDFIEGGHEYKIGDSFLYDGKTYRVAQAHTSQAQWKPGEAGTESLYYEIVIASDGILVWHEPVGSHDAPGMGVKRHYPDAEGKVYVSKRDGNTSEPGTEEWWELEGEETVEEPSGTPSEYDPEHQYAKGERCIFNGKVYEWTLDIPGVWSPESYPTGWNLIEG